MEVFGKKWTGYTERLEKNWRAVVTENDTVVIPGDVSWSISLAGTESDFTFLHSLPGRKILGKGNHDFWWSTETKMNAYLSSLGFDDIRFLHNNAFLSDGRIVCGTRGWFSEDDEGAHGDFEKLVNREATRLQLSLDAAKRITEENPGATPLAFFHFPPVWGDQVCRPIDGFRGHHPALHLGGLPRFSAPTAPLKRSVRPFFLFFGLFLGQIA